MAQHFTKMVNLARTDTDREREHERMKDMLDSKPDGMEFPPGCCICLTDEVLEKLGIDEMPEEGDTLHLCCEAKVTGYSSGTMGKRVELQITGMACDNEDGDDEPMSSEERAEKRYG